MKRTYTHIKAFEKEMLEMKALGKPNRQIAEHLGLRDLYVVKEWIKRYNRQQENSLTGYCQSEEADLLKDMYPQNWKKTMK